MQIKPERGEDMPRLKPNDKVKVKLDDVVPHSQGVYVLGKDIHTNSVEGFWSQPKRSIDGTYHHVTPQHLQKYVDEYGFRYSHRNDEQAMFRTMMERVVRHAD